MTISPFRLAFLALLLALIARVTIDYYTDQRDTAVRNLATVTAEAEGLRQAAARTGEMLADRDRLDKKHTEELSNARTEIDALRHDIDLGNKRLLVRATCPGTAVPGTTGTPGLADAGTAELTSNARSDYFALREQLALARQMILGLQDYIRTVVLRPSAQP